MKHNLTSVTRANLALHLLQILVIVFDSQSINKESGLHRLMLTLWRYCAVMVGGGERCEDIIK